MGETIIFFKTYGLLNSEYSDECIYIYIYITYSMDPHLWWFERIICREVDCEKEDTSLVWAVTLQ